MERDGILNHVRVERGQQVAPTTLADFRINTAALGPLMQLKEAGYTLIVTSNQPGLSRGYQSRRELDIMHDMLKKTFPIDDILMCPHDEQDDCPCRKPRPGLLQEAGFSWQLDLEHSFVISDKWQDARAAHNAGTVSMMIESPWIGDGHHDFVLPSLEDTVSRILHLQMPSAWAVGAVGA